VWNEPWIQSAGGGALSSLFSTPSYQVGLGFGSRAIPDVSYNAAVDGGVLVYTSALGAAQAGFYVVGGTSAGAPQWAGLFALANQGRQIVGSGPLGPANPLLYAIAQSSAYSTDFHDIAVGNNQLTATPVGYNAVTGFDLATGWGTPNALFLVIDLATH